MYKTFKYSTDHLTAIYIPTKNHYEIFDQARNLIAIYTDINNMKLSSLIPEDPTKYEYFEEIKEIIMFITNEYL